ncbi:MAG: hypothetical protein K0R57_6150 [Paenibacillaceae bacterium]|nr:hypothetical protein [Paenibacillaceae bacterium]
MLDLQSIEADGIMPRLRVPEDYAAKHGIGRSASRILQFGNAQCAVRVNLSRSMPAHELAFSEQGMRELNLPAGNSYALKQTADSLIIGPYVGILLKRKKKNIAPDLLDDLARFYDRLGGALLVFAGDSVRMEKRTIEGFVYNARSKLWTWEKDCSYPAAIFCRAHLSKTLADHFNAVLGKRIFNDYRMNKWRMHQILLQSSALRRHIPQSRLLRKPADLVDMLGECKAVYIKPLQGSGGRDVMKALHASSGFSLVYRREGERFAAQSFRSVQGLSRFVEKRSQDRKYMLQQGIELLSHQGRLMDFRLVLVKDGRGSWKCTGIIARYGPEGSIVSNINAGGHAEDSRTALRKVLKGIKDEEIGRIHKKMKRCALAAAQEIEANGIHAGNLGIDLALDAGLHVWILEVNHNDPDHTIALDAGKQRIYEETIACNLLYARKLAGFGADRHGKPGCKPEKVKVAMADPSSELSEPH